MDKYAGVYENYFKREELEGYKKDNQLFKAYIYLPTEDTIKELKLSVELDKNDNWKEEIKKFPEVLNKFPELGI